VLGAACLAGCAATPRGDPHLLDFLDGAGVTRAAAIARLGPAYATYENGRVVAYLIDSGPLGPYVAPRRGDWRGVDRDLILVFDANDMLAQHRLIPIRDASRTH